MNAQGISETVSYCAQSLKCLNQADWKRLQASKVADNYLIEEYQHPWHYSADGLNQFQKWMFAVEVEQGTKIYPSLLPACLPVTHFTVSFPMSIFESSKTNYF